ncbi:hypothetical protein Tco_1289235, partial [Tanacetum coccineum]
SSLPTKGMRSIISMVSISFEDFMPSILLLMVIIVAVVIITFIWVVIFVDVIVGVVIVVVIIRVVVVVMIIRIVVVVVGVPSIIKLSFVIIGISLGPVFLLGLLAFVMAAACASRAAAIPLVISCRMAASIMVGATDVDVLLGGIYMQDNTE